MLLGELGVEEAVSFIRSRVLREGRAVSEVVDAILPLPLSADAQRFFLRLGLISYANDEHHRDRSRAHALWRMDDPLPAAEIPLADFPELGVMLSGKLGDPLPLIEFSREDWGTLEGLCRAQARGWLRRAATAKAGREACSRHETEKTSELPRGVLKELAEAIGEAWGAS